MFLHFSPEIRHEFARRQSALDQLVATELHRIHLDPPIPFQPMHWACRKCQANQPCNRQIRWPAPAELAHAQECDWLQNWLDVPESLRDLYEQVWEQRSPHGKRMIRSGIAPPHLLLSSRP